MTPTKNWTREEISEVYYRPILELIFDAAKVHREYHDAKEIQICALQSIKTGNCSEDCGYCSQSSRYDTGIEKEKLQEIDLVLAKAKAAKNAGNTRFCMGAVGKGMRDESEFKQVLAMVNQVSSMGLETCCTLGMLTKDQAKRLKEAGLHTYNHNLDTGKDFYPEIVTTHSYEDRLQTIDIIGDAGISLCCGGIMGMGEGDKDRIDLITTLSSFKNPPESIPVNTLVPIPGTPMEERGRIPVWDVIRSIATIRIVIPTAIVRLAAGREQLSDEEQALCFLAGANSFFSGEKLLTTPLPGAQKDADLLHLLSLTPRKPFKEVPLH